MRANSSFHVIIFFVCTMSLHALSAQVEPFVSGLNNQVDTNVQDFNATAQDIQQALALTQKRIGEILSDLTLYSPHLPPGLRNVQLSAIMQNLVHARQFLTDGFQALSALHNRRSLLPEDQLSEVDRKRIDKTMNEINAIKRKAHQLDRLLGSLELRLTGSKRGVPEYEKAMYNKQEVSDEVLIPEQEKLEIDQAAPGEQEQQKIVEEKIEKPEALVEEPEQPEIIEEKKQQTPDQPKENPNLNSFVALLAEAEALPLSNDSKVAASSVGLTMQREKFNAASKKLSVLYGRLSNALISANDAVKLAKELKPIIEAMSIAFDTIKTKAQQTKLAPRFLPGDLTDVEYGVGYDCYIKALSLCKQFCKEDSADTQEVIEIKKSLSSLYDNLKQKYPELEQPPAIQQPKIVLTPDQKKAAAVAETQVQETKDAQVGLNNQMAQKVADLSKNKTLVAYEKIMKLTDSELNNQTAQTALVDSFDTFIDRLSLQIQESTFDEKKDLPKAVGQDDYKQALALYAQVSTLVESLSGSTSEKIKEKLDQLHEVLFITPLQKDQAELKRMIENTLNTTDVIGDASQEKFSKQRELYLDRCLHMLHAAKACADDEKIKLIFTMPQELVDHAKSLYETCTSIPRVVQSSDGGSSRKRELSNGEKEKLNVLFHLLRMQHLQLQKSDFDPERRKITITVDNNGERTFTEVVE